MFAAHPVGKIKSFCYNLKQEKKYDIENEMKAMKNCNYRKTIVLIKHT